MNHYVASLDQKAGHWLWPVREGKRFEVDLAATTVLSSAALVGIGVIFGKVPVPALLRRLSGNTPLFNGQMAVRWLTVGFGFGVIFGLMLTSQKLFQRIDWQQESNADLAKRSVTFGQTALWVAGAVVLAEGVLWGCRSLGLPTVWSSVYGFVHGGIIPFIGLPLLATLIPVNPDIRSSGSGI